MTISSRTPEGYPLLCPICNSTVIVEPSIIVGDTVCPKCGQLLWFYQISDTKRVFDTRHTMHRKQVVSDIIAEQLGVSPETFTNNPASIKELGADSLETIELVMELEEEYEAFRS